MRKSKCIRIVMLLALVSLLPAHALAADFDFGSTWRSVLLPGSGQAHQGHYKKATVFAGAAILSAAGVFLVSIQYNQSSDKFNDAQREYNALLEDQSKGKVVNINDLNGTYQDMESAWNDSETRFKWRTAFTVALVATYTLNIVDILMSDPHDPDTAMRSPDDIKYGIDYTQERVLLVRSWRF